MYWSDQNKQRAQELVKIAEEMSVTAAQLSIAWCLKNPAVTSVILGASKIEQLKENIVAIDFEIPDEMMKKLDELYPPVSARPTA